MGSTFPDSGSRPNGLTVQTRWIDHPGGGMDRCGGENIRETGRMFRQIADWGPVRCWPNAILADRA